MSRSLHGAIHATLIAAVLSAASCSEKDRSDGSLTATCRPSSAATGKEYGVGHPSKPSECRFGAVKYCNACVYDDKGALTHTVSEPCGVCVGISF